MKITEDIKKHIRMLKATGALNSDLMKYYNLTYAKLRKILDQK